MMKPKIREYKFKSAARLSKRAANKAGARLAEISSVNGGLTAETVVKDAKPNGSPLHGFFEWDNTAAAKRYRLIQAQYLIRSMVVVYEDVEIVGSPVRAFVSITDEETDSAVYVPMYRAMNEPEMRAEVVERAMREAQAWQARYMTLEELGGIFGEIERAAKTIGKRKRKRRSA